MSRKGRAVQTSYSKSFQLQICGCSSPSPAACFSGFPHGSLANQHRGGRLSRKCAHNPNTEHYLVPLTMFLGCFAPARMTKLACSSEQRLLKDQPSILDAFPRSPHAWREELERQAKSKSNNEQESHSTSYLLASASKRMRRIEIERMFVLDESDRSIRDSRPEILCNFLQHEQYFHNA
jgi:hypothetical protein